VKVLEKWGVWGVWRRRCGAVVGILDRFYVKRRGW